MKGTSETCVFQWAVTILRISFELTGYRLRFHNSTLNNDSTNSSTYALTLGLKHSLVVLIRSNERTVCHPPDSNWESSISTPKSSALRMEEVDAHCSPVACNDLEVFIGHHILEC
eukprot:3844792-Pleurochrysis_carterae.AAC.1